MTRHVSDETFRHVGETIFQSQRSPPETNPGYQWPRSNNGFDHVGVHPQLNLPRISQDLPVRNAQARSRLMDLGAPDRSPRTNQLSLRIMPARIIARKSSASPTLIISS